MYSNRLQPALQNLLL